MIIMNNKLKVKASSLGKDVIRAEANFITFIEVRYLKRRGWMLEFKISAQAFLDELECNFGSGDQCTFLEKKLPMKIPKLVFPYDVEHFKKPIALRSLLGVIETLNNQFRFSKHHYMWIDDDNKALSIFHGCSSK